MKKEDRVKLIIDTLSIHFKFKVIVDDDLGNNELNLELEDGSQKVTADIIEEILKPLGGYVHVSVLQNTIAMLIDVNEPYVV